MVMFSRLERQLLQELPIGIELVEVNTAMKGTLDGDRLLPLPDRLSYAGANMVQMPAISTTAVRAIRSLIGDNAEPYYFTNRELQQFYQEENQDVKQASALACEVWASQISYDEGGVSAGGVTIQGPSMASDKRQRAAELRMQMVFQGY